MYYRPFWVLLLFLSCTYSTALADDPTLDSKSWGGITPAPSENECRSFIEAALKEQRTQTETGDEIQTGESSWNAEGVQSQEDQVIEETTDEGTTEDVGSKESGEVLTEELDESAEKSIEKTDGDDQSVEQDATSGEADSVETGDDKQAAEGGKEESKESDQTDSVETITDETSDGANVEESGEKEEDSGEDDEQINAPESSEVESKADETHLSAEDTTETDTSAEASTEAGSETLAEELKTAESKEVEGDTESTEVEGVETADVISTEQGDGESTEKDDGESAEKNGDAENQSDSEDDGGSVEHEQQTGASEAQLVESDKDSAESSDKGEDSVELVNEGDEQSEEKDESKENQELIEPTGGENSSAAESAEHDAADDSQKAEQTPASENLETESAENSSVQLQAENIPHLGEEPNQAKIENATESSNETDSEEVIAAVENEEESPEQEDLTLNIDIPENLRSRNHISEVLMLDVESVDIGAKILKAEESTLRELKRIYEAAIKPLEILYKYRDLSNRHFGDPEIFSKPLILFMGPWSGGKSTIINYLLDNEYKSTALRTGAEPSPAYFNIVMWGERQEILDGTQLAADWTFSGLQKFGQGLLDRLRGLKMDHPLLEKVNVVEIPGILEIRKQVERMFPFNDACQWFIDRADIIFLVYDPAKLDAGPETEAILDQLKGREYQTKIILNKADQVKPEELMRVQGTLIWNISPLMSSTEPPVMYSTSLWSHPYQPGAPSRLLFAQEKAFLKDLRDAIEKRVENKISSARRFAVRVRNHAKMVDCYLTTYYNHKTFFGNKQKVSDDIIEHPQNYHIYEGLSTLTNISRYDLPDPDVYRDFFRLNPVYDFQQLSSTCTYFKGCPINRLDVAIAYDLPELVGKYKKMAEDIMKVSLKKEKK